jgi:hypothetical protein
MYGDDRISKGLHCMVRDIEVPPVSLATIRYRMGRPAREPITRTSFYVTVAAATAIALAVLPIVAPAFVQRLESRIVETVLRWSPPPPPSASLVAALRSQTGTLAKAQSIVKFTIVAPVGLPKDVTSETIATMPGADYSLSTRAWSVGTANVWFTYRRRRGASFQLMAAAFDPHGGPPSKYIVEEGDERNGRHVYIVHDKFAWRNGDQVMTAITGDGITKSEINAIRSSMRGTPIVGVWPPLRHSVQKMYVAP